MDLNLQGKNALVGGSSKGIGKAIAIELALLGANVTLVARSADLMSTIVHELDHSRGQHHDFLVADFSDSHNLNAKIKSLVASKTIHILINNTGGPPGGAIFDAELEAFQQAFHNHVLCNQILVQAVVPGMIREAYGRIINVISSSVKVPVDNLGVSNTTRGAVASWSKTMANELGRYGITVNNVLPGYTETERLWVIVENTAQRTNTELDEVSQKMKQDIPLNRFGKPSEIAAAAAFLATPAAAYITGTNLLVDGGRTRSL